VRRFRDQPDHLQIWPAHGAGSACGKGLGAIPSSTVGYEKLMNPALQFDDEDEFVQYILADQPETPPYFAVMKRVNKVGPALVSHLPPVTLLDEKQVAGFARERQVVDTTSAGEFAAGHVPGTIHLPPESLVRWAGFLVDYDRPVFLITGTASLDQQLVRLRSIGIDNVGGYFDAAAIREHGMRTLPTPSETPERLSSPILRGATTLLDVRSEAEFRQGNIPGAEHRFVGTLNRQLEELDRARPVAVYCQSGGRSAIAASILQRAGFDVTDMQGGFAAWTHAGLPVDADDSLAVAATTSCQLPSCKPS